MSMTGDTQREFRAWLRANDIDPAITPRDPDVFIDYSGSTSMIVIDQFVLDDQGQRYRIAVPLLVAPPVKLPVARRMPDVPYRSDATRSEATPVDRHLRG